MVDWPWALEAVRRGFQQLGRIPDGDSLNAAAAIALYLGEELEKGEKGEKSEIRYGLNVGEARALLARIYLGQPAKLTEVGRIEMVDGGPGNGDPRDHLARRRVVMNTGDGVDE